MKTDSTPVQNRSTKGSANVKGSDAEHREPDHVLAAESVAQESARKRADGDGRQEHEEIELRRLKGHAESLDQVERVVARDRRRNRSAWRRSAPSAPRWRRSGPARDSSGARESLAVALMRAMPCCLVPAPDIEEHDDREQRHQREPGDGALAEGRRRSRPPSAVRAPGRDCRRPGTATAPVRIARPRPCAPRARIRDGRSPSRDPRARRRKSSSA